MKIPADDEKQKKVLVVEDNEDIANILIKRLQKTGYEVQHLATGLEVLTMLAGEGEPAAIILDLMIPDRSGLELLSPIKAKWNNAKLFVFSSYQNYERMIPSGLIEGFFLKTEGVDRLIGALEKSLCEVPGSDSKFNS